MQVNFSDEANAIIKAAQRNAQNLHHEYVGTEHILMALAEARDWMSLGLFQLLSLDPVKVRDECLKHLSVGPEMAIMGKLPMTPRAKKVLEYATEAIANDETVTPVQLLYSLLREQEGLAAIVLMNLGVTLDSVDNALKDLTSLMELDSEVSKEALALGTLIYSLGGLSEDSHARGALFDTLQNDLNWRAIFAKQIEVIVSQEA